MHALNKSMTWSGLRLACVACVAMPVGLSTNFVFAQAARVCADGAPVAQVIAVDGTVSLTAGDGTKQALVDGIGLCPGDEIFTGDAAGIDIRFDGKDSVTNILSNALVTIPARDDDADIELEQGLLRFISSVRGVFNIRTPFTDAGIDGTEAMVDVRGASKETLVLVREGTVTTADRREDAAKLSLVAGSASFASAGQTLVIATPQNVPEAFQGYLTNPEGAADWAVYYPPILFGAEATDPNIKRAAELLDAGQPDQAEALLRTITGTGPVAAQARALWTMAAVFRNRPEAARELGIQAVGLDPKSGPARIAQSYALQAVGEIDAARNAARLSTELEPGNAYAWARLAELELTVGNRVAGTKAAERSLALRETALAQTVLGFAQLSTGDADAAATFGKAIALEGEAPLPRLGLGLAKLNAGDTAGGRLELETAASLDPQRASLRGWLGRAYLEEGLPEKALAQFRLAQEQDPDDPTAWLFEADTRFSGNEPVVALQALQQAIDKADGRATVRGRRGLGEDQAAQSAAAGRIFDTLGFAEQAFQAGARAVAADPTNAGAHRLLADLYRTEPGQEIAQTSERLLTQLLSGPTNDPIQPQLGEVDLSLLDTGGPGRVTFHEFNPLIDGDGFRFVGSGLFAGQGTVSDEASLTLKDGNFSVGVGQFFYRTDGFLPNNDIRHDIVSLEVRAEPTPGVSLFAEIKGRKTEGGDREISFLNTVNPTFREEQRRLTARLGGNFELTENIDLLVVGTLVDLEVLETQSGSALFGLAQLNTSDDTAGQGGDIQAQVIAQDGPVTIRAGASALTLSNEGSIQAVTTVPAATFFGFCPFGFALTGANCVSTLNTLVDEFDRHFSGYVYADIEVLDGLDLTLGLSGEHLRDEVASRTSINPKAGLLAEPIDGIVLRAAYAKTLKRPSILDQTLEPTTIAGFNQFFDDEDRTEADLYAFGIDLNPFDGVWLGGEVTYRDLATPLPIFGGTAVGDFDSEELRFRGYVNAAFFDRFAVGAGAEHVTTKSNIVTRTSEVTTFMAPLQLSYFDPSGFFASGKATYVRQEVDASNLAAPFRGTDDGLILDAIIGFRLPEKRGVLSFQIQNITDERISFQDEVSFTDRAVTQSIARERTFMGMFSVVFD